MKAVNIRLGQDYVPLKDLLDGLIEKFGQLARERNNYFLNYIPEDFFVNSDSGLLNDIFGQLLSTIVESCRDCRIRLSAKSFHSIVLVHVTVINGTHHGVVIANLPDMERMAETLGGCLSYNDQHLNESTFTLSFRSVQQVA